MKSINEYIDRVDEVRNVPYLINVIVPFEGENITVAATVTLKNAKHSKYFDAWLENEFNNGTITHYEGGSHHISK